MSTDEMRRTVNMLRGSDIPAILVPLLDEMVARLCQMEREINRLRAEL